MVDIIYIYFEDKLECFRVSLDERYDAFNIFFVSHYYIVIISNLTAIVIFTLIVNKLIAYPKPPLMFETSKFEVL